MVSRRKILSRSRDDLNMDQTFAAPEEEEDVWYQTEKLFKEHIQEVLDKWTQIDDEIWAKVIVFERNRRVAKAYARAPVLTINGSNDGFDGMRIGLCGFDNPMRDQKTDEFKRHIGQGVKIKMDDAGNILIRRYAKSNVYVKSTVSHTNEETSIGADIMKLPNQALESEKIVKLFDMKKFQSNVNRELRRAYPDRRRLETQCLSSVAFVKSENEILECPIWVLIVNVVAMDMLKSKLPPVQRPSVDIKNRPRIPIPDEDPYSVAGNGSGGSSGSSAFGVGNNGHQQPHPSNSIGGNGSSNITNGGITNMHLNNGGGRVATAREQLLLQAQQLAHKRSEKPPKLPPRDNIYSHDLIPKPDYDDIDVESRIKLSRGKSDKGKDNKKYDDPYYCGLRARVPNFVKSSKLPNEPKDNPSLNGVVHMAPNNNSNAQKKTSMVHMPISTIHAPPPHMHPHHAQKQQLMAVAAAHAVHHPAAAHHPMWQNGIGIYTPLSNTATTNYFADQDARCQPQSLPQLAPSAVGVVGTDILGHGHERTKSKPHKLRQAKHHYHSRNCMRLQKRTQDELLYAPLNYHGWDMPASQFPRPHGHHTNCEFPNAISPHRMQSSVSQGCNCVSCYALAPLFGAALPTRPPRSLSQQQLQQHQCLSGNLNDAVATDNMLKWCSESDISELERIYDNRDADDGQSATYERSTDEDYVFNANMIRLLRQLNDHKHRQICNKKNRQRVIQQQNPKLQKISTGDVGVFGPKYFHNNSEIYPSPLQSPFAAEAPKEHSPSDWKKYRISGLSGTRNKSLSIESFFEQPNEEGSLYLYGGRKRVLKAPSTTNIYNLLENSAEAEVPRNNLNYSPYLHPKVRSNNDNNGRPTQHLDVPNRSHARNNENVPSCNGKIKSNENHISNIAITPAAPTRANNLQPQSTNSEMKQIDPNRQLTNNSNGNHNNNNIVTTTTPIPNASTAINDNKLLQAKQQRLGRSNAQLDISNMESIYGYLKPRKPRSLSLKKIQILDY